jgi:hypothetical protein
MDKVGERDYGLGQLVFRGRQQGSIRINPPDCTPGLIGE